MLTVALFTLREAVRRWIVLAALAMTLLFLVAFGFGAHYINAEISRPLSRIPPSLRPAVLGQVLLMGLWVVNLLGSLVAIFSCAGAVANDIDSGVLQVTATRPLARWRLVLGKWLGLAALLALYVALTSGAILLTSVVADGYAPPHLAAAVGLLMAQVIVLVSLTVALSTRLPAVAAGVVLVVLYSVAVAGGMLTQLGSLLRSATLTTYGVWTSIVLPSNALWQLAAARVQPEGFGAVGAVSPLGVITPPSLWMLAYAGVYTATCVVAAVAIFDRRDL